jgi:thioredoxin-dependent peroxiredoxin
MKPRLAFLLAMALSFVPLAAGSQQPTTIAVTNLKVGEVAPDFTLLDNHWHPVKLSEYRGKDTVVLAFYVLAFTSG